LIEREEVIVEMLDFRISIAVLIPDRLPDDSFENPS